MPGVPGQRSGPPPKRSDQRRRQNKPELGEITKAPGQAEVPVPEPIEEWHPLARYVFDASLRSGQTQFYQESDYAILSVVCESLSRDLKPTLVFDGDGAAILDRNGKPMTRTLPLKGANLSAYLKAAQSLLLTEGDRRRLRIELEPPQPEKDDGDRPANVLDFASRLTG